MPWDGDVDFCIRESDVEKYIKLLEKSPVAYVRKHDNRANNKTRRIKKDDTNGILKLTEWDAFITASPISTQQNLKNFNKNNNNF